jgi:hypothetical protein
MFNFVLSGRKVAVEFNSSETNSSDDALVQSFLVRADGGPITLEAGANGDSSVVTKVDITPFDTNHGDGPQVIPW